MDVNPQHLLIMLKSLDLFIMESWSNVKNKDDAYIQWTEYSRLRLTNIQEMTSLRHIADWLDPRTNKLTIVALKQDSNSYLIFIR